MKFNAVMNMVLTVSNMFVGIITIPYVTRVLSVEGYGNVSFAQNLSTWLSTICLVGIPAYGVRECAKVRDDQRALASLVRELLIFITIFKYLCYMYLYHSTIQGTGSFNVDVPCQYIIAILWR